MEFFLLNIVVLGVYGVFSYFFIKNRKKAVFFESIVAAIYFPLFAFLHLKNKENIDIYTIQIWALGVILFEIIMFINIIKNREI